MAAFSNVGMRAIVKGKPHIVFISGLWRVSPKPKPAWNAAQYGRWTERWNNAHNLVARLNSPLLDQRIREKYGTTNARTDSEKR